MTLHVHTTHAFAACDKLPMDQSSYFQETASLPRSKTPGAKAVYLVMLWWSNPFHIFTGFVEAGLTGDSRFEVSCSGCVYCH